MVDKEVSLDELKEQFGATDEQINQPCSNKHLRQIAKKLDRFKRLAEALSLSDYQITAIDVDKELTYLMKIQEVLKKWKEKYGSKATYGVLAQTCLVDLEKTNYAEEVLRLSKGMISVLHSNLLSDNFSFCLSSVYLYLVYIHP